MHHDRAQHGAMRRLPLSLLFSLPVLLLLLVSAAHGQPPGDVVKLPAAILPDGADLSGHYSGYLDTSTLHHSATSYNASLFYYFVTAASSNLSDPAVPVVVWLQGGPGCTSLVGLLAENGPFVLIPPTSAASSSNFSFALSANRFAWSNAFHMLYIDQPIGTGFSPPPSDGVPIPSDETAVAATLYLALCAFFEKFPALDANTVILAGESYAGKYIPSLATLILLQNEVVAGAAGAFSAVSTMQAAAFGLPAVQYTHAIALRGLAMGNALIDPAVQRFAYRQQALSASLINSAQAAVLTSLERVCSRDLSIPDYDAAHSTCADLLQFIGDRTGHVNAYDIRRYDASFSKPLLAAFMQSAIIREALHVPDWPGRSYEDDCASDVQKGMAGDVYRGVAGLLPALLTAVRVLLYNGNFDLKDGSRGTEELITSLPAWPDRFAFLQQPRLPFYAVGTADPAPPATPPYGFAQSWSSLTTVVVPMAGHFSPRDQSEAVQAMMQRWVRSNPFCAVGADDSCVIDSKCQLPGKCGEDAKRGKCVADRCECGVDDSGVQWSGALCEIAAINVTQSILSQASFAEDVELACQQTRLYHFFIADDSALPLHLYTRAHTSQANVTALMDVAYLAHSPTLTPATALTLLSRYDPSNRFFHHHHPLLSPSAASTFPSLLSSSRNTASDMQLVTALTAAGHYALSFTNLQSPSATFSLSLHPSTTSPSLALTSFTFPFNSTAVGLLSALFALAAAVLLLIVAVRRCAMYRRKGGKRYGKVEGEGGSGGGSVVGPGVEGAGEWEEGAKEMDVLELQLSDETEDQDVDLSEITISTYAPPAAPWVAQPVDPRAGKRSPLMREESKVGAEPASTRSPERVVVASTAEPVNGMTLSSPQGGGEAREGRVRTVAMEARPLSPGETTASGRKKKKGRKRPE